MSGYTYNIYRSVPELLKKVTIGELFDEMAKSHLKKGDGSLAYPLNSIDIALTNAELSSIYNAMRKNKIRDEAIVQIQKYWSEFERIGFNLNYVSLYDINRIVQVLINNLVRARTISCNYKHNLKASDKIRENLNSSANEFRNINNNSNSSDDNNKLWAEKINGWNKDKTLWSNFESNPDVYDFTDCNMEELWYEAINMTLEFYKNNQFTVGSCKE